MIHSESSCFFLNTVKSNTFQLADIVLWLEPALLFLDLATAEHEILLGHILGECVVCHFGA